jgi:hypothetical protein
MIDRRQCRNIVLVLLAMTPACGSSPSPDDAAVAPDAATSADATTTEDAAEGPAPDAFLPGEDAAVVQDAFATADAPAVAGGTLTATIDGAAYVARNVMVTMPSPDRVLVSTNDGAGRSLNLTLPASATGMHACGPTETALGVDHGSTVAGFEAYSANAFSGMCAVTITPGSGTWTGTFTATSRAPRGRGPPHATSPTDPSTSISDLRGRSMNELESLRDFMARPAPRTGGDEFLAAVLARARLRRRFHLAFGAAMLLFFVAVGVLAGWPDGVLDAVVVTGGIGGAVLAAILGPVHLYQAQELTHARELLARGERRDARVVSTATTPNGVTIVRVAWEDGSSAHVDFRAELTADQRAALPGEVAALVRGQASAIYLPGVGVVATR